MTIFLIIAGAGALLVAMLMVWPLMVDRRRAVGRDSADAALYRDQLEELDRDVARGTVTEAEAEGARAEIARRLIAATRRAEAAEELAPAPPGVSRIGATVVLIAAPALAALIYLQIGSPGQPDMPLASRTAEAAGMPSQEDAERIVADRLAPPEPLDPEYAALMERLEKIVAERPNDIQGLRLLARGLARSGRWVEARRIQDRLISLLGEAATPNDLADHAETMIFAAAGYVSPEATNALEGALRRDPGHVMARYYAGFALRQAGRESDAVSLWHVLLQEDRASAQPRGAEWQEALAALIRETGGADGTGADTAPGPTREDVEAAGEMTAEERQAFVASMVARLEERLTTTGGEAEEWVRLINAYVQLGRTDDARRILALSQESLGDKTARAFVRERALLLGVTSE